MAGGGGEGRGEVNPALGSRGLSLDEITASVGCTLIIKLGGGGGKGRVDPCFWDPGAKASKK